MHTLIVATHNQGKLKEIQALLHGLPFHVYSASERSIPEPEETGDSFIANARLKAEHASALAPDCYVLADDSGMEVACLDGQPGIYSARWGGETKDFTRAMRKVEDAIRAKGLEPQGQEARFISVLALAKAGQPTICFEGIARGTLTFPPRGTHGFGYDPIFIPQGHTHSFAELSAEEKQSLSHRTQAFTQFHTHLTKILL
jgi:XTP/dITP diphosphohydrolase